MTLQRRRIGGWAAIVIALALAAGAPAQEKPEDAFLRDLTEAYVTFGRANRAREESAWAEALSLYEDAHAQYRRLHNLYPDRQTDIVQYRLADCANRIEDLRRRAGSQKKPAAPPPEAAADPRGENARLRDRLSAAETNAARAAVAAGQDIARLTRELEAARRGQVEAAALARAAETNHAAQLAESARQLEAAQQESARLRKEAEGDARRLKKAQDEKEELGAAHRELQKKLQSLTDEWDTARVRLEAEKAADEAALSEARRAGEQQGQRLEQAERKLAEAIQAGDAARAQLAQAEKNLEALEKKARKAAEPRDKEPAGQDQDGALRADLEKARRDTEAAAAEANGLKARVEAAEARALELERSLAEARAAVREPDAVGEAAILENEGRLVEALAAYRAADDRPDAVKGAGRCLLKLGRTAEGVTALKESVAREPGDPETRLLLGIGLCTLRRYRQAAETLGAAVPLDPRNAALRNALGVAWIGLGHMEEARKELEQAVSLNEDLGDAHLNLALVLAAGPASDRDAARRHYSRALELGVTPEPHLQKKLDAP